MEEVQETDAERRRALLESAGGREAELVTLRSGTLADIWGADCVPRMSGGTGVASGSAASPPRGEAHGDDGDGSWPCMVCTL